MNTINIHNCKSSLLMKFIYNMYFTCRKLITYFISKIKQFYLIPMLNEMENIDRNILWIARESSRNWQTRHMWILRMKNSISSILTWGVQLIHIVQILNLILVKVCCHCVTFLLDNNIFQYNYTFCFLQKHM